MKLGKHWVEHIKPSSTPEAWIPVVNEIPTGSCCKYRLDKTTGQLKLARTLPRSVTFPTNYGFIPHTRSSADDEETDVMILSGEPLLPLTIVRARLIGGFFETADDEEEPEERLVAVAVDDPNVENIHCLDDLDDKMRDGIEKFVCTYKENQDVGVSFDGWFDREAAFDRLKRGTKLAKKRAAK
jgi:inorganic pyrophosphatase